MRNVSDKSKVQGLSLKPDSWPEGKKREVLLERWRVLLTADAAYCGLVKSHCRALARPPRPPRPHLKG